MLRLAPGNLPRVDDLDADRVERLPGVTHTGSSADPLVDGNEWLDANRSV